MSSINVSTLLSRGVGGYFVILLLNTEIRTVRSQYILVLIDLTVIESGIVLGFTLRHFHKLQYECTMSQSFDKITHLATALYNIHTLTREQGGDMFELPPYSEDLTPIDTDCSIVKRHVSRMSNIKDRFFLEITIKFGVL